MVRKMDIIILLIMIAAVFALFLTIKSLNTQGSDCVRNPIGFYNNLSGNDECSVVCLSDTKQTKTNEPTLEELNETLKNIFIP